MTTSTRTVFESSVSRDRRASVTAVVIDYRNPALVSRCLSHLLRADPMPADVVVVDVDPVEETALPSDVTEAAETPRLRIAVTSDNPGYAAACNRGAAGAETDWILFMNSDVLVEPDTIGAVLAEVDADHSVGIATPRLLRPDGSIDHACHRGIPSPLDSLWYKTRLDRLAPRSRRLGRYRLTWLDTKAVHDVEACSGAFLLIRRAALEAAGGWDERYWFYAEDLDLCLRVTQAGWRVRYVGTTTALHLKSSSSHVRRRESELDDAQRATRRRVKRAIVDSHQLFYREHLQGGTARPLRPLVDLLFSVQRRAAERGR